MLLDQTLRGLAAADLAVPVSGALAVDVADGDDLHPLVAQERLDVVEALVARPDHRDGDPIAGRDPPAQPQRTCRHDRGKRQSGRHALNGGSQEITPRVFRGHRLLLVHQNDSRARGEGHREGSLLHEAKRHPTTSRAGSQRGAVLPTPGMASRPFFFAGNGPRRRGESVAVSRSQSRSGCARIVTTRVPENQEDNMIRGVHTMFYSSQPEELRAFLRDKLGFPCSDVGEGWLIFDLPEADMGCHPADPDRRAHFRNARHLVLLR